MTFLDPIWLRGLFAVPLIAGVILLGYYARRAARWTFYGPSSRSQWSGWASAARQLASPAVTIAAIAAVLFALARPGTDPRPRPSHRQGRDVVFVIDVSRSMLADDLRPSRLARAKLAAQDVIDSLSGDRVGIVAFAGTAVAKSPLTTDYGFARMALDDLSPDSVSRGGTAIGDAIRLALDQLFTDPDSTSAPPLDGQFRDLILLTDGEDHETDPIKAAAEAGRRGVRIIALGLGSSDDGAPVPSAPGDQGGNQPHSLQPQRADRYMSFGGERVRSKMNPESLRQIAEATPGGVFINVGTGNIQLDNVYARLSRNAQRREFDSVESVRYTELFQLMLAFAIAALFLEPFIRDLR